ncbi:hypothetical protein [Roseibium alexandrii]|uniref:Uncharacterized protein n=1 Tax=Roseibium alexandrii (strain DSM 17067 / NCIMB 14079 / DFL-11) TaxID=244592 RepID=A0A5E8H3W5_ROSAD|nr:hypothetical protein [Roseibium alexandrii]EEE46768.1 hypothetical protein SADFL11_4057 [Roseibium alexandrii DFL-11]
MTAEQFGKRVLTANALFCAACGFALIMLPGVLTELMFVTSGSWLFTGALGLGAGLVTTAAVVLWASRDTARMAQRLNILAALDAAWVLASAIVLLEFAAAFTATGWYIVAGIALIVADFAVAEFLAARKLSTPAHRHQRAEA